MQKIKKILILLFVAIIVLMIIIYLLLQKQVNKQDNQNENTANYGGDISPVEYNNGFSEVSDYTIFFSIENAIEKYEKICKFNIDTDYSETNIYINEDEYLLEIKNEEQRKKSIYDLLDKEYISKNKITIDNIDNFIYNIDVDTVLVPKKLIYKYETNINTYIYETYFIKNQIVENKAFIIRIDNTSSTFSIEFVNEGYEDISRLKVNINNELIVNTGYNKFSIKSVKTEQVIQEHLNNYKEIVIANPSIIYNDYLSNEYKNKRYGSLEEFEKYVKQNMEQIKKCQIIKYAMDSTSDSKEQYACIDQYENYYIFEESSTMQYTLKLDTYTILTDKFKETYSKSDDKKKVQMNVDKFIQMINRHDYKTSYNCVSSGFKNNYLDTQEKFERFIKNVFFEYNKFEFKNIEQNASNIYICTLDITDLSGNNSETKTIKIIMKLNDNYDFEISFGN